jgi:hypothetical protein
VINWRSILSWRQNVAITFGDHVRVKLDSEEGPYHQGQTGVTVNTYTSPYCGEKMWRLKMDDKEHYSSNSTYPFKVRELELI